MMIFDEGEEDESLFPWAFLFGLIGTVIVEIARSYRHWRTQKAAERRARDKDRVRNKVKKHQKRLEKAELAVSDSAAKIVLIEEMIQKYSKLIELMEAAIKKQPNAKTVKKPRTRK